MKVERTEFPGAQGQRLAARLDAPEGEVRAYALFAHCFTCGKNVVAAKRIADALTALGIAVLRFDFTGIGSSEGEFANTTFSSNVADLVAAADHLRKTRQAPALLIGHSLGGAAVLAAAPRVPEAVAVATVGAPATAAHVTHNFAANLDEIEANGKATVTLAGRQFTITKQFLDDVASQNFLEGLAQMKKALLVCHAPRDDRSCIVNMSAFFSDARQRTEWHPVRMRADRPPISRETSSWMKRRSLFRRRVPSARPRTC